MLVLKAKHYKKVFRTVSLSPTCDPQCLSLEASMAPVFLNILGRVAVPALVCMGVFIPSENTESRELLCVGTMQGLSMQLSLLLSAHKNLLFCTKSSTIR